MFSPPVMGAYNSIEICEKGICAPSAAGLPLRVIDATAIRRGLGTQHG
jgi:hypothetical protein